MPGNKTTHAARVAGKNGFSLIPDDKFREMYAALLRCSMLDTQLRPRADYTPWTGCRAGTAGVVTCLRAGDAVTPTPRGALAGYLHHGKLDLQANDAASGAVSQLATATGDALRHKLENRGSVAVVFTTLAEPRAMRSVFSAAAQQSLPVLYILEGGTPSADVCGRIPVMRVDAADTVAVYRVAYESIHRAREGGGPTILECAPWPGDEDAEPLARLEHYLAAKKLFRRDWKQRLEKKYAHATGEAVARFLRK
ncbi:MAG TPA: thiamine pyrophosphate-dependent enzyme [Acidobacteriaceae bacterium]|nr:thiamine pyrophosphate-dependent enzyme [Acidobacteriaceae bacterium]